MAKDRNANQITSVLLKSNANDDADVIQWGDPTTHRALVQATISGSPGTFSSAGDGTTTVTLSGTAVQLPSQACSMVTIQAHESNAGTLVVGASTVVAALVGRRGAALYPTNTYTVAVSNLNLLYIDSTSSGDKINYVYFT